MSREASTQKRFASEHGVALAAFVAGAIAIAQSWLRWLHPYIDAGRDLYIPEQLRLGARLYRDILYFYPPLTPYLLAVLHVSSLGAYVALGFAIAGLTALAMWTIVRPLAGAHAAGAALLLFFALNVCGTGGWGSNYFFPYAHAATIGMLLFLGGASLRGRWVGVVLLLLAAWTKIEFALFGMMVACSAGFQPAPGGRGPAGGRRYTTYLLALAASIAIVYASPTLRANILPPSLLSGASAKLFYAQVTGIADWRSNLLLAVRGAVLIAIVVVLLRAFERYRIAVTIGVVVCAVLLANASFFRAWAILQLVLIPFALRRWREPLAFLLLLSLCGTSRIWLNLAPSWYGFVFTVPLELLIVYVLFAWLPERGVYTRRAGLLWLIVIGAVAISGLIAAHRAYADGQTVATKRGTYHDTSKQRAAEVASLLAYLDEQHARELVVVPEGLALNWLARVPTPLRYQTFTPVEIAGDEASVLRELSEKRPERVAVVPRDVREFGYRGFGADYGQNIVAWLRENYIVEQRFGEIVLLTTRRGTPRPDSPSARTPVPSRK